MIAARVRINQEAYRDMYVEALTSSSRLELSLPALALWVRVVVSSSSWAVSSFSCTCVLLRSELTRSSSSVAICHVPERWTHKFSAICKYKRLQSFARLFHQNPSKGAAFQRGSPFSPFSVWGLRRWLPSGGQRNLEGADCSASLEPRCQLSQHFVLSFISFMRRT